MMQGGTSSCIHHFKTVELRIPGQPSKPDGFLLMIEQESDEFMAKEDN